MVQQSTIGALGRLCCDSRLLQEHSGGCASTDEYQWRIGEAVLVQKMTIGALGRLCWYSRVL